jgi:DNA topoisomerase-3
MSIMEKLYNKGYLSYPRTETTKFNPTINLRKIVSSLEHSTEYGEFARKVGSGELWGGPKNGKLDDKAHPPIHPVKNAKREELLSDEWKIYELLTRHFLATISKDAVGSETTIMAEMGGEDFTC